jgi:hypothetical protein
MLLPRRSVDRSWLGFRRRRASLSKTHQLSLENRADLVSKTPGKQLNKLVPLLSKVFARRAGYARVSRCC